MNAVLTRDAADECDAVADRLAREDERAKWQSAHAELLASLQWERAVVDGDVSVEIAGHSLGHWITDAVDHNRVWPALETLVVRAAQEKDPKGLKNIAGSLLGMAKVRMLESLS